MTASWWQNLAPRERRVFGIGVAVALSLLVWAFVWHPLDVRRSALEQSTAADRDALAYVRVATAEVARLRAAGMRSRSSRQGKSLLALADATARGAGLESSLKRVEPVGSRSVRVSFEFANFDALMRWLEDLSRDYGVEASDLSADRADAVGLVNARVTLEDAP
ncbi:MAG TPA: type II secretion system protein M [Rhodanobacteraceae bacterium]|nr:type II secretion system protein M [Rhodanobacteraceae bacterium]